MHIRSEVLSGMDEVSFSSKHDSIAKSLIFIPVLQYPFCGYYILVYDISFWTFFVHKPRFGHVTMSIVNSTW